MNDTCNTGGAEKAEIVRSNPAAMDQAKPDELRPDGTDDKKLQPTILGWILRIVSIGLLVGLVSVIVWKMLQPEIDVAFATKVDVANIRSQGPDYLIPIEVSNQGSKTATLVNMAIDVGGEEHEVEIPIIGQNETVTFVVASPVRVTTARHRIVSYVAP